METKEENVKVCKAAYTNHVAIFFRILTPPPPQVAKREHFDNPPFWLRELFHLPPLFKKNSCKKVVTNQLYIFMLFL